MGCSRRVLIIGSAPHEYVVSCVREVSSSYDEVAVLSNSGDALLSESDNITVHPFKGKLDVFNFSLAKAVLSVRPDAVYVVYGSWLGHNNVFIAVNFYMALLLKKYTSYLFSKVAQEVDLRERISHPYTRVDLGLSLTHWLFLPLYLLVRLIAPLLLIRFEQMRPSALGHFEELEIYLGMKSEGRFPERTLDVFCYKDTPCNEQIMTMFRRKIRIIPWARYLLTWNNYIPGGEKHSVGLRPWDYTTLITQPDCHIEFTRDECERAIRETKQIGLESQGQFVCLGFRDNMFDQKVRLGLYGKQDDQKAQKQLDLHAFRNADIVNAGLAAEKLNEQGYKIVRMGSIARPLPDEMKHLAFDYANWDGRNDFLDIYLGGNCRFFITTGYGLDTPPLIFRRPMVSVNTEYRLLRPNVLYTFRHHWSKELGRPLSFRELFETGVAFYSTTTQFEENGIELRENSPEEILDAVNEMEARVSGTWHETEEDRVLQKRFWDAARPHYLEQYTTDVYTGSIRIGTEFLKKNPYLLD